jgi:hypothetical protein
MAEKSWWVDLTTRDEFERKAAEEQLRMSLSPEARKINGMIVAWSRKK